jgi:catechol 2,3-dioxygenase-like lactoylglutathione lyase family enzyme
MALPVKLDHCVIHVSDWERSNAFYRDVIGAQVVSRGAGFAYRFGDTQLNCHGPGVTADPVARLPVQPGNSDVCFEWNGPIADAVAHLARCQVAITGRAQRRQGERHQRLLPRSRRLPDGIHVVSVSATARATKAPSAG